MSPPPHYRWYIVALTLVNQALALGILIYSFALFVVPWLDEFDVTRSRIMMTILSFQIVLGVLSPILGRLMDQYAMRWMVMAGALSTAVGLFLLSLATSLWQITVIYMTLLPFGIFFFFPGSE